MVIVYVVLGTTVTILTGKPVGTAVELEGIKVTSVTPAGQVQELFDVCVVILDMVTPKTSWYHH
jgi:hypothetical protein